MYRQDKSHLTYQIEGRISNYLSEIDNCKDFKATSQIKTENTLSMTEAVHSLLQHIRINCLEDNQQLLKKHNLILNKEAEINSQFLMSWTSTKEAKTISGYVKIDFLAPNIHLCKTTNFKIDNIQSLSNILIDLTTITFVGEMELSNFSFIIVKTKCSDLSENAADLNFDLEKYCCVYKKVPTFLFLKIKNSSWQSQQHYSNFDMY